MKESRKELITRLRRAQGQLGALIEMIEKESSCETVLVQFKAVKAAMESAFAKFLETSLQQCLAQKEKETLSTIIKLICQSPLVLEPPTAGSSSQKHPDERKKNAQKL